MTIDPPFCVEGEEKCADRHQERRGRPRLGVEWPLHVWRSQEDAADGVTANLSSSGVYWISTQRFSVGETLTAIVALGGLGADREPHKLLLRCELMVLRVEELAGRVSFGVACRIVDYSVRVP